MFRFFKKKRNYEYWINLSEIIITKEFAEHKPRKIKMSQKYDWYLKHGEFQSPIVLNRDFVLVDGYTSYLIAKEFDLGKVPAYFE